MEEWGRAKQEAPSGEEVVFGFAEMICMIGTLGKEH